MEFERLPSGIFFNAHMHEAHVGPPIDQQSWRGHPGPAPLPSVGPETPDIQDYRAFRVAPTSAGTDGDRYYLPLLEVSLDVTVIATTSRTRLRQTFSNHSKITIKEATYCFPLYDGSAVIAFRCWTSNSKILQGKIKPKEVAKAEFQEAISRQRVAVLLEELTPEVFEMCLGNIPPQTTVNVEITYINELKADLGGDGVLVTIPTSVAPRYGTPPADYARGSADGSTVAPAENGLAIQVEVSALAPIYKLESRTHPISVELGNPTKTSRIGDLVSASVTPGFDPKKARATLSDRATTLGKDFVLLILVTDKTMLASRALLEPHPSISDHSALMVTINPQELFASTVVIEDVKAEIIFLADRSGSMHNKIDALISAMRIFLKSIPQNCYFNICSFGWNHSLLWPESRPYTQENVDIATKHVTHSFASDMGGTEILSALKHVVEKRNTRGEMNTEVIVLTDGEVWDTENIIKFVQETRQTTEERARFFALGVGDAVSHRLIEGIGRQGGGFAEVVAVDAAGRWESRVIRMLKGALTPSRWQCEIMLPQNIDTFPSSSDESTSAEGVVSNHVSIPQPPILQAPNQIPSLHAFSRSSVYFFVDPHLLDQMTSITVQARAPSGERVKMEIPLERVETQSLTIHHLAAKALMNDLEIGRSWMHADKYQECRKKDPIAFEQAVQQEAEKVGTKWSISGKWTSFVAVDNNGQIEQKARIYRAERSELADLTRPRWTTGYPHTSRDVGGQRRLSDSFFLGPPMSQMGSSSSESANIMTHSLNRWARRGAGGGAKNRARASATLKKDKNKNRARARATLKKDKNKKKGLASEVEEPAPVIEALPTIVDTPPSPASPLRITVPRTGSGYSSNRFFTPLSVESKDSEVPGNAEGLPSVGHKSQTEARVASPEITLDALVNLQTSSGSFILTNFPFRRRFLRHFSHKVMEEMTDSLQNYNLALSLPEFRTIIDTVLVVVFIEAQYSHSAELWELVVLKARGWVKKKIDPEVLRRLEKIARDNMQTPSAPITAPGFPDVQTKLSEPAVSKANAEIVEDNVGEDNVKKDSVEDRAEKDTVVEAESR